MKRIIAIAIVSLLTVCVQLSPAADDKLFVGTEKRDFWIVQAGSEKKVLNRIRFPHRIYNTPVVANGVMYVATERYLYAIGK